MVHESTVKGQRRIREEAGDIADCPDASGRISLFDPLDTLPNHCTFRCPCNSLFLSLLRLFAANQHNLLSINNLQPKSRFSN
jgi:hypothetical protein